MEEGFLYCQFYFKIDFKKGQLGGFVCLVFDVVLSSARIRCRVVNKNLSVMHYSPSVV